jgi:hypothetical protein
MNRIPQDIANVEANAQQKTSQPNGVLRLAISIIVIALTWMVVFPWIAAQPPMRSHLDWLDDRGIDPSAMYYTELEVMEEILQRQRSKQRRSELSHREFRNVKIKRLDP